MERDSEQRLTGTRDLFLQANQELDASASKMGLSGPRPYLCECSDPRCTETMLIDGSAYTDVRASPGRYVVVPGHEGDLAVVDDAGAYRVVERRQ